MRKLPFYPIVVLLLIIVGGYLGCDPDSVQLPLSGESSTNASNNPQYSATIPERTEANILIGSFNLNRFGPAKLADAWVMERLAEIVRRFDIIALQEITSQNQPAVQLLVNEVNASGAGYAFTASPPLGRSENYAEQYAFIYDSQRVLSGAEYTYVVSDEADLMHREPFVSRFLTRTGGTPFRFTLINVHADPDDVTSELNVLASVYVSVRQFEYPEDDVLLLGDLNADPQGMQNLARVPALLPLIADVPTNASQTATLDNILVDGQTTREFTGRAGTIDLESMFDINAEQAKKISDHLPVWAEFTIVEQTASGAAMSTVTGVQR